MNVLQGFFNGLKPIPATLVSDWANNNRYLSSETAAEPGKWRTSKVPYMKEIMDALSPNSPVNEVVFMKGVQISGTEAGLNVMGCYADISPCPIMYVMPTIEVAKDFSGSRVDTMINLCPSLAQKVRPARERDSGNTIFLKKFPGGSFKMSGANSAASLRSKAVRVLILDEVDAYPLDVDGEGSPIALAKKRQVTFGLKKKLFILSTPTMEHTSVIEPEYLKTDQRKLFLPCPHCGEFQILKFSQLRWEHGKGDLITECLYECEGCQQLIEERFKPKMLASGEWRPTAKQNLNPLKRGYWLPSLNSPLGWLSWVDIAKEYERAETSPNDMKVFVNTILAETSKESGDVPPWENLYNRREDYKLNKPNNSVYFITIGVDVQKDRLELHVMGWGKQKIAYSIDYRVLVGDTSGNEVWDDLAKVVNETWEREDGLQVPMARMAVDSGYNTSKVYEFCRRFDTTKVIPIKGKDGLGVMVAAPRQVDTTSAGKKIGKVKVWNVGVSLIKSELYGLFKLEKVNGVAPPGYLHFPQYAEQFFRGLTAEQLIRTMDKKGFAKYEWIKKYHFNEALDTTVYARAAASVIGMDRMQDHHFESMIGGYTKAVKVENKPKKRSDFWDK